jgi:pilus assembly protein Flp/PilA
MKFVKGFLRDDTGVTAIEYALLGLLIAVVIIVGATAVGGQLDITYTALSTAFPAAG